MGRGPPVGVGASLLTDHRVNVGRRSAAMVLHGVNISSLSRLVGGAVPTGVQLGRPLTLGTPLARCRFKGRVTRLTNGGGLCAACVNVN